MKSKKDKLISLIYQNPIFKELHPKDRYSKSKKCEILNQNLIRTKIIYSVVRTKIINVLEHVETPNQGGFLWKYSFFYLQVVPVCSQYTEIPVVGTPMSSGGLKLVLYTKSWEYPQLGHPLWPSGSIVLEASWLL